jgi:hypothetical protein
VDTDKEHQDPLIGESMEGNKRLKASNSDESSNSGPEDGWETECDSVDWKVHDGLQVV